MNNLKNLKAKALLGMVFLWSMSACINSQNNKQQVLRHIVCFQFKEEVSIERQTQAIEDFMALKDEIPEIKKFEGGEDVSTEGLNKGFTHSFILTFESEEARDAYLPHPAHLSVVKKNKPLFSDLIVVDVWGEE